MTQGKVMSYATQHNDNFIKDQPCNHSIISKSFNNLHALKWIFRCYEVKIEESEKAGSCRESNPGHQACAASALPLSYNSRTTTSPHNPLYVLHRWDRSASVTHVHPAATQYVPSELN